MHAIAWESSLLAHIVVFGYTTIVVDLPQAELQVSSTPALNFKQLFETVDLLWSVDFTFILPYKKKFFTI